jgi:hypothetical protein
MSIIKVSFGKPIQEKTSYELEKEQIKETLEERIAKIREILKSMKEIQDKKEQTCGHIR